MVSPHWPPSISAFPLHWGGWAGCSQVGVRALGNVTTCTGVLGKGRFINGGSFWTTWLCLPGPPTHAKGKKHLLRSLMMTSVTQEAL